MRILEKDWKSKKEAFSWKSTNSKSQIYHHKHPWKMWTSQSHQHILGLFCRCHCSLLGKWWSHLFLHLSATACEGSTAGGSVPVAGSGGWIDSLECSWGVEMLVWWDSCPLNSVILNWSSHQMLSQEGSQGLKELLADQVKLVLSNWQKVFHWGLLGDFCSEIIF